MRYKNSFLAITPVVLFWIALSPAVVVAASLQVQSVEGVFSATASVTASASGTRFDNFNQPSGAINAYSHSDATVSSDSVGGLHWWPTAIASDTEGNLGIFASLESSFGADIMTSLAGVNDPEMGGPAIDAQMYANSASLFAYVGALASYDRPSWKQAGFGGGATDDNMDVTLNCALTLRCSDYVNFTIAPRRGEQIGDAVPVTVSPGWNGQVRYNGTVYNPHATDERIIYANVGDTVGLKFDTVAYADSWSGVTEDHVQGSYRVFGDMASSGIGISIPLTAGLWETNGQAPSATPQKNHFIYTGIFQDGDSGDIGVNAPVWLALGALAEEYELTITDNALLALVLPSTLPYSTDMNVQFFDGSQWLDTWEADEDGYYGFYPGASIFFDDPVTRLRLTNIDWTGGSLPDTFSLGLIFADVGTQVDIVATRVVPEPATLSLLALGGLAMIRRRRTA